MTRDLKHAFGRRLADLRRAAGLSQVQLAKALGTVSMVISRMERGESSPSFARMAQLAHALGVDVIELFAFDASPPAPRTPHEILAVRLAALLKDRSLEESTSLVKMIEHVVASVDKHETKAGGKVARARAPRRKK